MFFSLKNITISNSVKIIYNGTFYGCNSLENVIIPVSITEIEEDAFYNCTSLKDVYYAGSANQWNVLDEYARSEFENATIHFEAKEIPEPLTPDVNRDGAIDASDASCILAYYAYVMTGGKGTIEEFMAK